jgi:two-component system chemotaxis response regulator CheB
MDSSRGHDVIVVGASMGGIETLSTLVGSLPRDLPASVFVVQHVSRDSPAMLGKILNGAGPLPATMAEDDQPIERSHIYVAPPDRHLLVMPGKLRLVYGPRENRWRPAIDPMFRSAAVAYATRVIGVVLTGALDDGTAGMVAVKRCGGIAVVQDPTDAAYPDMPRNVLEQVEVDHTVPLGEIGGLLTRLARGPAAEPPPIPADILAEVRIMSNGEPISELVGSDETVPQLSCPECGGPLTSLRTDSLQRYRCTVGHAFTAKSLLADQTDSIERALWAAVRVLDERTTLLTRLARDARARSRPRSAVEYEERAAEARGHAEQLRELLEASKE